MRLGIGMISLLPAKHADPIAGNGVGTISCQGTEERRLCFRQPPLIKQRLAEMASRSARSRVERERAAKMRLCLVRLPGVQEVAADPVLPRRHPAAQQTVDPREEQPGTPR